MPSFRRAFCAQRSGWPVENGTSPEAREGAALSDDPLGEADSVVLFLQATASASAGADEDGAEHDSRATRYEQNGGKAATGRGEDAT